MKKLLITGSSGVVGSDVLDAIIKDDRFSDYKIYCTVNKSNYDNHSDIINYVKCDLLNKESIDSVLGDIKPDTLLHIAWDCKQGTSSINNYTWMSFSTYLFKSFYENGGRYIIGIGSFFEYKECIPYAKAKSWTYQILRDLSLSTDMNYCWIRLFNVVSMKEKHKIIPYIINCVKNNQEIKLKTPEMIIDCIHTKEVAKQILDVLHNRITGEVDVGSGFGVMVKDILELINNKFINNEIQKDIKDIKYYNKKECPLHIANLDQPYDKSYLLKILNYMFYDAD